MSNVLAFSCQRSQRTTGRAAAGRRWTAATPGRPGDLLRALTKVQFDDEGHDAQ